MTATIPANQSVEDLLGEAFGGPVTIAHTDHLAPWTVIRCHLAEPTPGLPTSVIVKWLRDHPTGFRTDPRQVCTERAALEFLAELQFRLVPHVLASDLAAGILVLEDLAPRVPLAGLLRDGGIAPSTGRLEAFARSTGQLAAATRWHSDAYHARRAALGPFDPNESERVLGHRWNETSQHLDTLGLAMTGSARRDLASVVAELANPGPFLAFTNGDTGTNNFLVDERRDAQDGRIIDFESAGYRHALTAATWIHMPGAMWITVTDPVNNDLESHYRDELSRAVPEAADDRRFGFAMAAACAAEALQRLNRFPNLESRTPGDDSRVQMIATLEAAAGTAEHHRSIPALGGWLRATAELLRRRWKDADVDLSCYRSYTMRT
ncbi:hypothetical protein [Actinopolymorpha alba]|uniref:hypothetical protein n=1 Tax=Actinopolymorpha alba TaxID=533267 RepID=UPI0004762249|nr:hypothetical protein [Actinopolymorpha alba]